MEARERLARHLRERYDQDGLEDAFWNKEADAIFTLLGESPSPPKAEQDPEPERPNHSCGPESQCDGICVEHAAWTERNRKGAQGEAGAGLREWWIGFIGQGQNQLVMDKHPGEMSMHFKSLVHVREIAATPGASEAGS